jgi:O-antigen biosynthesis protein
MTAPGPSSLVTVILPAWRDERFVEFALRSVVDQDHEALEVIVVDDGTQHPAAGAIRGVLEREDVRQRFRRTLHVEERGCRRVSEAINRGLRESRGDYVNVLEPGDAFATRRLSRLLRACAESGAELAFARIEPRADTLAAPRSSLEAESIYCVQDDIEFFPTVGYALLKSHCTVAAGNLFFSRRLAEHVDGFGDQDYFYGWDFALRSLLVAEPMFVPEPLLVHRLHGAANVPERQKRTASEIESILKNYLFLCRNRRVLNPLAPSPAWGPFFESFVQASHYNRYLAQP